jgi:predicted methyltransferase MtxX (methanogen marker protein 4)
MRLFARVSADMPSLVFEAVERPRAERTLVRPVVDENARARVRESASKSDTMGLWKSAGMYLGI